MSPPRFLSVYPRMAVRPMADRFEYREKAGWRWLQKTCFAVLRWIGAQALETVIEDRVTLDAEKLSAALINKHIGEVHRLMWEPGRLVLGAEDWHDLMDDPVISAAIRFQAPLNIHKLGSQSLFDVDVTIVPWMRGLVVLPKEVA